MIKSFVSVFVIISFLLIQNGQAEMSSYSCKVTASVISGGGAPMSTSRYDSNSTLAQTIIFEPVSSEDYDLYSGFWRTLDEPGCIWDLDPADGDVDGLDLYRFLTPDYNASDIEGFGSEFGGTDCL